MPRNNIGQGFHRKTILALAASAALAPPAALAIDLVQAPPGTVEPYVRPNVIISIDDSGSMGYRLDQENATGATNTTTPNPDGSWPMTSRRMNVLKYSLRQVFNDTTLLPEKKIRLAWQAMNANNGAPGSLNTGSTAQISTNSMKVMTETHRSSFQAFINQLKPSSSTPSHKVFKQADEYMRLPLNQYGPWASDPGNVGAPYLGCRRNYHIMMTDGRWNGAVSGGSQDDNTKNRPLPDGTVFGSTNAATRPYNKLYSDPYSDTLADWAFYSWSKALQPAASLTGSVEPAPDYRKAAAQENFGVDSSGNNAVLDRYWNPRYNPATWAHMVTYTIGFSNMAITWPGAADIVAPSSTTPFGYDGSFPDFITGKKAWPKLDNENKRALDLWHAALNGRGRFYAVTKGEDLEKAFREIFGQINTDTTRDLTATATSGANSSRNDVGKFTAAYEPDNYWKGFVSSELVKADGSAVTNPAWGGKNTADKLDEAADVTNRLVLSWGNKWLGASGQPFQGGVPFKWVTSESNLSNPQKALLGTNATTPVASSGQKVLEYLRGDRSLEGSETSGYTAAKPFRERKSRQGDIVNSVVWYTGAPSSNYALKGYSAFTRAYSGRTPMLYVGGNDGMLHGFSATDGYEKIAYVPRGVIPNLKHLADPAFNNTHQYFVDGSPMTGDVDMGTGLQDPDAPGYDPAYVPSWRTMLVGTLGAGGKGYFILDVTNPAASNSADGAFGFIESNAQKLVQLDRTRGSAEAVPNCASMSGAEKIACDTSVIEDKDIGNITARPVLDEANNMRTTQITRMNNNRWAVVLGNGYNSTNQRPVLLVQYLDGAKELLRVQATTDATGTGKAADNGLSAPRLVDINGDGRPDVAYAGDNLGNMWKFDLTSINDALWKVAFGGNPLFSATGPASLSSTLRDKVQPITAPATVRANDRVKTVGSGPTAKTMAVGGMMVAFGTGRNVTEADASNVNVQTLYSVLDNTRYRSITTSLGKRLEVHPGGGTCPNGDDCVPAPAPLGTGVTAAKLAKQKITELSGGDFGTVDVGDTLDQSTWANFNGWYMDYPAVGERQLKPFEFYDGSNILAIYSQVPAKGSDVDPNIESCESTSVDEERQYRTLINVMDGKRPSIQIVDMNGDGQFNSADSGASRRKVSKGSHNLITKSRGLIADIDAKSQKEDLARMPEQSLRPSWRQMK